MAILHFPYVRYLPNETKSKNAELEHTKNVYYERTCRYAFNMHDALNQIRSSKRNLLASIKPLAFSKLSQSG